MADVVSLITTSIALAGKVVSFLKDAKHANEDRTRLRDEVSGLYNLLVNIESGITASQISGSVLLLLQTPVNRCNDICTRALMDLRQHHGLREFIDGGMWHFKKGKVAEALGELQRVKSDIILILQNDIREIAATVEIKTDGLGRHVDDLSQAERSREECNVLNWLSPIEPEIAQKSLLRERLPGTGQWFINSKEFQSWAQKPGRVLHCQGIPGSGKTSLAALAIDHLKQVNAGTVAYIYCGYRERTTQKPEHLLGSLLKQLTEAAMQKSGAVYKSFRNNKQGRTPLYWEEMQPLLTAQSDVLDKLYIVVDALDDYQFLEQESAPRKKDMLSVLLELVQSSNASLMVTSRNHPEIRNRLSAAVRLNIEAYSEDVRGYLQYRVGQLDTNLTHCDDDFKELIVQKITASAQGMYGLRRLEDTSSILTQIRFLLPKLHMNLLSRQGIKRNARKMLANLPTTGDVLETTYSRAMADVRAHGNWKILKRLFAWTTFSERDLSVTEIRYALAIEPDDTHFDPEGFVDIRDCCSSAAGLLSVNEENQTVRLVHLTTRDFLLKNRLEYFPDAQLALAKICLTYLSFDEHLVPPEECDDEIELARRYPFMSYAATSWGSHLRKYLSEKATISNSTQGIRHDAFEAQTIEQANAFSRSLSRLSDPFLPPAARELGEITRRSAIPGMQMDHSDKHKLRLESMESRVSGLHIATYFDLRWLVRDLLAEGMDPDLCHGPRQSALHWASKLDRLDIAGILLAAGADAKGTTPLWPPLHQAVTILMAEMLLSHGAEINVRATALAQRTVLGRHCYHNRSDMVRFLLPRGADPLILDKYDCNALSVSMIGGVSEEVVEELLKAASHLDLESRRQLLTAPRSLKTQCHPLHRTVCNDFPEVARMIVEFIQDHLPDTHVLDLLNEDEKTALMVAVERANIPIARTLMHAGADTGTRSRNGYNCLDWALYSEPKCDERAEIVKSLLDTDPGLLIGDGQEKIVQTVRMNYPEAEYPDLSQSLANALAKTSTRI